ncbi:Uncharacterized conserved protein [Mycobacteroides abscessus subsp. massiliense]|uniref:DUF2303 family protein n=1 Tax=Mycobacteroides abscessus TaxID=36809 RepID=UPI0009A82796|nr:DUF2303 family protein [Mycobacteroides abscessus]SKM82314.1 Uncharacterized conserved protein [Mycobacteroides abscessus subsp. massiliense]SKM99006.1 Uncharacterized conserved protein [Mycobacteroides abscessus subsp. massiliense]SKN77617.1 Uncharacterized conserved protein [Mycobacteroides abscessus subsp. massiliense]SKN95602.1 Uncharacterized conserved protein [Mycobacteroides abscessus subsp. massiliense]SKO22879.1 Uncharacterized conserved protein [Mycobacteroides abscessus subsp. ma
MTDEIRTEADAVAELTRAGARGIDSVVPDNQHLVSYVTRDDETREFESLEEYLPNPRRDRGTSLVLDVGSFNLLLTQLAELDAIAFANRSNDTVTAVLNYNGWRDHRIVLDLQVSREWQHWSSKNGQLLSQLKFAEHLEDGLSCITAPPAADLMEVAQTFQTKRNVSFESGQRVNSGEIQFEYREETTATAGGKGGTVEVPERFELRLPVYERGASFELSALLRYRTSSQGLELGYKLDRAADVKDAAFDAEVAKLPETLKLVYGPAPEVIRAI